ncbi:unnamed protein product, partial [Heterosigma akashiwo]
FFVAVSQPAFAAAARQVKKQVVVEEITSEQNQIEKERRQETGPLVIWSNVNLKVQDNKKKERTAKKKWSFLKKRDEGV